MTRAILTEADVAALVTDLVEAGTRVIAPVPVGPDCERTEYRAIERLEDALLDGTLPRRSLKEFFRPPSQQDAPSPCAPQVILGARPCDAAGVEMLDNVMGWDYRDELWRARRAATTVVTIACPRVERSCFCTAVGIGPDSTRGADALLVPLHDASDSPAARRVAEELRRCVDLFLIDSQPYPDAALFQDAGPRRPPMRWAARAVTVKGAALLRGRGQREADPTDHDRAGAFARSARDRVGDNVVALRLGRPSRWLDPQTERRLGIMAADGGELIDPALASCAASGVKRLPEWLARNFDHEIWRSLAPRCRGCGHCSAVCSTSPCFDVDEPDGDRRRRQHGQARPAFAAPPTRTEQFRQRVMHKFSLHPRRFDEVLCTGCGRCSRECEGGMNLPAILGRLVQLAGPEPRSIPT